MRGASPVRSVLLAALVLGSGCSRLESPDAQRDAVVVTRGAVEQHLFLTGEVDTLISTEFSVPRTDEWNLSVQWLAEDGAAVEKGAPLIAFDNTAVLDKLNELELAAIEAGVDLTTQRATSDVAKRDQRFAVREKLNEVAKAKLDAGVPAAILSRKEARDFALALSRAEAALRTAKGQLRNVGRGGAHESAVKTIAVEKAERAYERAATQLDALEIKAPQAGIFVVKKHPWEDRKVQVGDNVWPGVTVGGLPDLSRLVIEADLSDVDEGRVQVGMEATCLIDAYPDAPLHGVVVGLTPVAQESEARARRRFFRVRVELDPTEKQMLRPGLSAMVDIVTRRAEDKLQVPRSALRFQPDGARAVLASGETVAVEVEFCTPQMCAVGHGLDEGQLLQPWGGPT